tara:strand:+ start:14419 stop:15168 length:750 start_codon:yes stop_codon:yes gene_type:complete
MAKRSVHHGGTLEPDADAERVTSKRTLIENVYVRLCDDIIEGQLAPGEKLRIEHLKTCYGVSAGTLREAVTRLISDAFVVSEGQRGFWVKPMSVEDLEDLTKLRIHIESEALRQSIRISPPQWRERVRIAYEQLAAIEPSAMPGPRKQWEALNLEFHEALISGCSSAWTQHVLRLLSRQSERYRRLAMHLPNNARDVHAEHALMFEAAMSGAEARAVLALEIHIRATPDLIARAHRERVIPPLCSMPFS